MKYPKEMGLNCWKNLGGRITSKGGINKHGNGLAEESMESEYLKSSRISVYFYEATSVLHLEGSQPRAVPGG